MKPLNAVSGTRAVILAPRMPLRFTDAGLVTAEELRARIPSLHILVEIVIGLPRASPLGQRMR